MDSSELLVYGRNPHLGCLGTGSANETVSWLVACTQPQSEAKVVARIRDDGFNVFFPQVREKVVHRGRRIYKVSPLFPSYAFVEMCSRFLDLFSLRRGQFNFLMVPETTTPAVVGDAVIHKIKSECNSQEIVVAKTSDRFVPGQEVSPKEGPLSELIGRFIRSDRDAEIAAFDLFSSGAPVQFKRGVLEAV